MESTPIPNDEDLLKLMMRDSKAAPGVYRPGPYWLSKTRSAVREILKFGLNDFRSGRNAIATSFADSSYLDVRGWYNYGLRAPLAFVARNIYPFSQMFDSQVGLTAAHFETAVRLRDQIANSSRVLEGLLNRYRLPESTTKGGCLDVVDIGGKKLSSLYLDILDTHSRLANRIRFSSARTFFEIGGGFGANVHILIENYKNLRKYIYLDIPPNLYVGTQYLRSFFGSNIKSYRETKDLKSIEFKLDDELEIMCIAPHQIEFLNVEIDIFQNSCSFVEMPLAIVENYARHVERLTSQGNSSIALVSYDGYDLNTTLHPDRLMQVFSRHFEKHEEPKLFDPGRNYIHLISGGS